MINRPFVGVCGIQTASDLRALEQLAADVLAGTDRFLMAGVKTVRTELASVNCAETVRPFVHCDFNGREPFEMIVERNIAAWEHSVCGLQLNVLPWMEVNYAPLFVRLKREYPHIALILQAHRLTMEYSPQRIADRLQGLAVDYILFDASQSRAIAYIPEEIELYIKAVCQARPDVNVVVAGGLCGPEMERLFAPLVQKFPALSCDAFGRLQDPITHELSWARVKDYLSAWKTGITASVAHHRT